MEQSALDGILNAIVRKLVKGYRPEKIILFGSFANGDPRDGSDIDLLIIKETKKRGRARRIEVKKVLDNPVDYPPVDAIVMTSSEMRERLALADGFVKAIISEGRVVYDRASA